MQTDRVTGEQNDVPPSHMQPSHEHVQNQFTRSSPNADIELANLQESQNSDDVVYNPTLAAATIKPFSPPTVDTVS